LNPTATALIYSTYLGGTKDDWAVGVAVDSSGKVWVTGATLSSDFPVSSDAFQKTYAGSNPIELFPTGDAWVAQLDAAGASMTSARMWRQGRRIRAQRGAGLVGQRLHHRFHAVVGFPATPSALQKATAEPITSTSAGRRLLVKISLAATPHRLRPQRPRLRAGISSAAATPAAV